MLRKYNKYQRQNTKNLVVAEVKARKKKSGSGSGSRMNLGRYKGRVVYDWV